MVHPGSQECGENEEVGSDEIVGVEGAFTGKARDPEADPTGLMMLLSMLDGRYWPIHTCGDTGTGAIFNDMDNMGQNVLTTYEPIDSLDNLVDAHACVLNCRYSITVSLIAEVIIAKINSKYNILRVRNTSFTGGITNTNNTCRCCGITLGSTKLFARIISISPDASCGEYPVCTVFTLTPSGVLCANDPANPLNLLVNCLSDATSEFSDIDDWMVYHGPEQTPVAEMISLNCGAPVPTCEYQAVQIGSGSDNLYCDCVGSSESESSSGSDGNNRLELLIRTGPIASQGGCDYTILIYSDPDDMDPCGVDTLIGSPVEAEACGLSNLAVGTRVIVATVPYRGTFNSESDCPPVRHFIIRACDTEDCSDPCEPPTPPGACCGISCIDLPATMSATIEVLDCDCACSFGVVLPKSECLPANEYGEWRQEFTGMDIIRCDSLRNWFELWSLQYRCGDAESESNSGSDSGPILGGSLLFNGVGGTLIESSCDPVYSVFELINPPICKEKFPGMVPPIPDLSCRVRVTIIE